MNCRDVFGVASCRTLCPSRQTNEEKGGKQPATPVHLKLLPRGLRCSLVGFGAYTTAQLKQNGHKLLPQHSTTVELRPPSLRHHVTADLLLPLRRALRRVPPGVASTVMPGYALS